jgi:hypothetical protein
VGTVSVRPGPTGRGVALSATRLQDGKQFATLQQQLGRQVVGTRKPWESTAPNLTRDFEISLLAPLRLARERQQAGLDGRSAYARTLLRCELDRAQVRDGRRTPLIDVEALLAPPVMPTGLLAVAGVVRPLPGGRLGVGDPGSGASVEAVGLGTWVARGSPVEVEGKWDAERGCLNNTRLVRRGYVCNRAALQALANILICESRPSHLPSNPFNCQEDIKFKGTNLSARADEAVLLPQTTDVLETAYGRSQLSLGTLCRVHELLVNVPAGIGGRLRDGPAIVRLNGLTTFVPPPSAAARTGAEVFTAILTDHLRTACNEVAPAVLAAECLARFTDLHPFTDGNGRVGRAIATWLLLRNGYRARGGVTLGSFFHLYQHEHYWTLRHHEVDPWSWHQLFFDAVLTCFSPPDSAELRAHVR